MCRPRPLRDNSDEGRDNDDGEDKCGHDDPVYSNSDRDLSAKRLRTKLSLPGGIGEGPGLTDPSASELVTVIDTKKSPSGEGEREHSQGCETKPDDGRKVPNLIDFLDLSLITVIDTIPCETGEGAEYIFQLQTSQVSAGSISAAGDSTFRKFISYATRRSTLRGSKRKWESV